LPVPSILYLDTSALIKLYIDEPGSEQVRDAVEKSKIVSTSRIAYVEARAGIARKFRTRELSRGEYKLMVESLEEDWPEYFVVEVSEAIVKLGGELVEKYPLRGFDAVHLASALMLKERLRSAIAFGCFDKSLNAAAKEEGLTLVVNG